MVSDPPTNLQLGQTVVNALALMSIPIPIHRVLIILEDGKAMKPIIAGSYYHQY